MAKLKSPKNKGSTFERKVAKILTEAFGLPFQRTQGSGAYTGGKNAVRKATLDSRQVGVARGDIIPPEELANLVIECKHLQAFNSMSLKAFGGKWATLDDVIKQVQKDGDQPTDFHMIIFRGNGTPDMLAVELDRGIFACCYDTPRLIYTTKKAKWLVAPLEELVNKTTAGRWVEEIKDRGQHG